MKHYVIKDTLNTNDIMGLFFKAGRGNDFTAGAIETIFDYLEETTENGIIEIDPIGICCQFTEYGNIEDLLEDYGYLLDHELITPDDFGLFDEDGIIEELRRYAWVESTGYSIVLENF